MLISALVIVLNYLFANNHAQHNISNEKGRKKKTHNQKPNEPK